MPVGLNSFDPVRGSSPYESLETSSASAASFFVRSASSRAFAAAFFSAYHKVSRSFITRSTRPLRTFSFSFCAFFRAFFEGASPWDASLGAAAAGGASLMLQWIEVVEECCGALKKFGGAGRLIPHIVITSTVH